VMEDDLFLILLVNAAEMSAGQVPDNYTRVTDSIWRRQ